MEKPWNGSVHGMCGCGMYGSGIKEQPLFLILYLLCILRIWGDRITVPFERTESLLSQYSKKTSRADQMGQMWVNIRDSYRG